MSLSWRVCYEYEYVVGDCCYYRDTLGGWVLCFTRRRRINPHTTRDCHNLSNRLAFNRQKTMEINYNYLFLLSLVQIREKQIGSLLCSNCHKEKH